MPARRRLKNWFEEEKAEGFLEGFKEGYLEGFQESFRKYHAESGLNARTEALRALLPHLIRRKLGRVSVATESRLAAATSADLELWAERVLSVSTISEVWRRGRESPASQPPASDRQSSLPAP